MSVVATLPPSTQTLTAPGHHDDYVPTAVSQYSAADDETVSRAIEAGRSLLEASSSPTSEFSDLTTDMARDVLGETFDGVGQGYDEGRLAAMQLVDEDGFIKAGTAYNNLKAMQAELRDVNERTGGLLSQAFSEELEKFSQERSNNNDIVQRSIAGPEMSIQQYNPQLISQAEPSTMNALVPSNAQSDALTSVQPSWMLSDYSEPSTPTQMIVAPQTGVEDQRPDLSHLDFDQLRDYFLTRVNRQQGRRVPNTPSLQQSTAQPSAFGGGRRPLLSQHATDAFYGFRNTMGASQSVESVCETMRNGGGDGAQWKQDSPDGVQRTGGHASGITADGSFVSVSYSSTSFGPSAAGRGGASRVTVDDGDSPFSLMPARYGAMSRFGGL
ncbi:hypothetical protein IAT38_002781 [Cryptococcus sp. DSM 104549]